jgi:hypothetical protein
MMLSHSLNVYSPHQDIVIASSTSNKGFCVVLGGNKWGHTRITSYWKVKGWIQESCACVWYDNVARWTLGLE